MNYQDEKDFEAAWYELYPFDAGWCDNCAHSEFNDGDTFCRLKHGQRCPSIRGCTHSEFRSKCDDIKRYYITSKEIHEIFERGLSK